MEVVLDEDPDAPRRSGGRTQAEVFAGIWTDNGDMWLQHDDFAVVKA
ncbi:hypothetical protein HDA40_007620 [Hamadaea flava]|uniref:Uncharacterized protein n=1 Tax=Hamadaea flava TaxID=1742688 RepID=A0ABV8LXF3_9ACTN|nr:hypothetical protein [Hamadaea flava]MCP2329113.1 hypothetical protein [Hamadaea flava]